MSRSYFKPLINEPVLIINLKDKKIMCIADLHLGIETEFLQKGININTQSEKILKKTIEIIEREKIDELILLGDIKHNIPLNTTTEYIIVPKFIRELNKKVKLTIIKGNHDTGLKNLLPTDIKMKKTSGLILNNEKIGFIHGHKKPDITLLNCKILILAHTHPAIKLVDNLFNSFIEPAWIINEIKTEKLHQLYTKEEFKKITNDKIKIIVLPAYNPLISGSPVNTNKEEPFLGPLLKSSIIDIKSSEIYLLDGTYLGNLSDIPQVDDFYLSKKYIKISRFL